MKRRRISEMVLKRVGARGGWRCGACEELLTSTFEIDHVVPLHLGGADEELNLQPLCVACHAQKTQAERLKCMLVRRAAVAEAQEEFEARAAEHRSLHSALDAEARLLQMCRDETLTVRDAAPAARRRAVAPTLHEATQDFVTNRFLAYAFAPPAHRRPLGCGLSNRTNILTVYSEDGSAT